MQKFFLAIVILVSIPILLWYFLHPKQLVAQPFLTSKVIIIPTNASPNNLQTGCSAIKINSPKPFQEINGILVVSITIDNSKKNCVWSIFDAQAGVAAIENMKGEILASAPLTTKDDWTQTNKPINFTATIPFDNTTNEKDFTLTIQEENQKGKANPQTISIPVEF